MSESLVVVRDLYRSFGPIEVLNQLSFTIEKGSVAGFIGQNGAGKTTTMKILATLDLPDAGEIHVFGSDLINNVEEIRPRIGWMPDAYDRYPFMTVFEYLDFFARAYGLRGSRRTTRVSEVVEFTELGDLSDRFIDVLSKGQSQRLCLARTLLGDPDLLILDEPAAGLDPKARVEFKHLVRVLAQAGKTLFISSHILSELEDMCDKLIFLKDGRVLHQGTAENLKSANSTGCVIDVRLAGDPDKLSEWIKLQPGLRIVEAIKGGIRIEGESREPEEMARILRRMVSDGLDVYEFRKHERKLEDAFIELVSDDVASGKNEEGGGKK
jgi:ABC-2 type transport system ATP-binding protein